MTLVLDASALIAHLSVDDAHHEVTETVLRAATGQALAISPITLAEVLVGPVRAGQLPAASRALDVLGLRTIALDADSPTQLATLRAQTGLKMPDCCVLVAARSAGASILTFDDRLAAASRTLGIQVLGA